MEYFSQLYRPSPEDAVSARVTSVRRKHSQPIVHHVLTRTDAKNQQTQYTYDIYGRLIEGKANWAAAYGSISGRVTANGQGVALASVVAIPPVGPAVSALTNPDGTYTINGLPANNYLLYVHPLPPDALVACLHVRSEDVHLAFVLKEIVENDEWALGSLRAHPWRLPVLLLCTESFRHDEVSGNVLAALARPNADCNRSKDLPRTATESRHALLHFTALAVDVIIERWQKLTGKQATLDGKGAPFNEMQLGRRQETD